MGVRKSRFGKTADGKQVSIYTMVNSKGMGVEVTDYGATLVAVTVPDKNGRIEDVVLGYDDVTDYVANDGYFGATIGRNGNRIGGAVVEIAGQKYEMDQNENSNNLHSGFHGFDKAIWETELSEDGLTVKFTHLSPHMDQGLPGNFQVSVEYTLTEDNELKIHYHGKTDMDTIANLTNHSYFNLSGHGEKNILEHLVWIDADAFTPMDRESIPTGEVRPVQGTPMDFTVPKKIGQDIEDTYEQLVLGKGYDHNYVLNNQNGQIRKCAQVTDEASGRVMEVYTDCVGVQFYTGNFITPRDGKDGVRYDKRSGFCLETQYYPDANHHENFPSSILKAGEVYDTTTIYQFK